MPYCSRGIFHHAFICKEYQNFHSHPVMGHKGTALVEKCKFQGWKIQHQKCEKTIDRHG